MSDFSGFRLREATKKDPMYRELLAACIACEKDYIRIKNSLSKADQALLEQYISLCEEMEYRRTCLAMEMAEK